MENYNGYTEHFLIQPVKLPQLSSQQKTDAVKLDDGSDVLHYLNYSVTLSATRRFPFFTASNIDGKLFKKVSRKDNWRNDPRVKPAYQWGKELYKAPKSDFDKGHMTKREDVQWGPTDEEAIEAADSTFYYTNAVPQHGKLNQKIWRSLEDYILHKESKENGMKISVFTGPVLSNLDPNFVTPVNGETIQIPLLFWKVVVFAKADGKLYRVGFLMSQSSLLYENGIVEEALQEKLEEELTEADQLFLNFKDAETYQVNISTIEKLSGLTMPKATDVYTDDRNIQLILQEVDVKESFSEDMDITDQLGFDIGGLRL
jgi:endonuclease G